MDNELCEILGFRGPNQEKMSDRKFYKLKRNLKSYLLELLRCRTDILR